MEQHASNTRRLFANRPLISFAFSLAQRTDGLQILDANDEEARPTQQDLQRALVYCEWPEQASQEGEVRLAERLKRWMIHAPIAVVAAAPSVRRSTAETCSVLGTRLESADIKVEFV